MNTTATYRTGQSTAEDSSSAHLGVIWPDTGEPSELFEMASTHRLRTLIDMRALSLDVACSSGPEWHSVEALKEIGGIDSIATAGTKLVESGADAIVWACTSGSFIGGLDWSRAQCRQLRERIDKPMTTGTLALISSALRLGFEKIDILSPYPKDVSAIFRTVMEDAGFRIGMLHPLHSTGATASAALPLVEECRKLADTPGDAVVVPDTAANTLEIIGALEEAAGKPVLTVNQVCLFEGALLAGGDTDHMVKLPAFRRFEGRTKERIL